MNIFVVILNYNNATDTIACVDSLKSMNALNLKIVLVDNKSNKECLDELERKLGKCVTFIRNKKNLGYAAGNNVGIKYAIENGADYIVVLNNDVVVNAHSFEPCIRMLEHNSDIAIVGPAIVDYNNNKLQSTGALIDFAKITTPLINNGKEYVPSDSQIDCDYVGGACMIFKPDLVAKIGYIPEQYFLFWEEVEWCYRAKQQGYRVVCSMSSYVKHKGSATIKKVSGISAYYMERNRVLFIKRNVSRPFIRVKSIAALFVRNFFKGLLKDRRCFEYFQFYFDGLRGLDRMNNRSFRN